MKKITNLFICLSVICVIFAGCKRDDDDSKGTGGGTTPQDEYAEPTCDAFTKQIVDGGFESCWYKVEMTNEDFYEYKSSVFYTLNNLHSLIEVPDLMLTVSPLTAFRDGNAHNGNYCMKLVTGELTDQSKGRILLPGAIAPLDKNFVEQFLTPAQYPDGINVKRAYTETPTALKGYFKYMPVAGDSASISVKMYNGSEVIAEGYLLEKNTVSGWTAFNVPITGDNYPATRPTHISIIFSASAGYNFADLTHCKGQVGSTMWIDDVELVFPSK